MAWRDPGTGRKVRRSLSRLERELSTEHRNETIRLGDYLLHVLKSADNLKESTRYSYERSTWKHILPRLGREKLAEVTPAEMRAFFSALSDDGLGPSVRAQVRRILSKTFRQALTEGLLLRNPLAGVPEPRVSWREPRVLTTIEVERLADFITPRYRAAVLLAAYTGLRIGEVGALSKGSLDLARCRVAVVASVVTAGGRHWVGEPKSAASKRSIPFPASLRVEVTRHMADFGVSNDGRIFTMPGFRLLHSASVAKPFKRARERLHLPAMGFHALRHHFAALLVAQGAHPKLVQALLGHSTIRTTMDVYGHLFPSVAEAIVESVELRRQEVLHKEAHAGPVLRR